MFSSYAGFSIGFFRAEWILIGEGRTLSGVIDIALIPVLMLVGVALQWAKLGLKASHIELLILYFTFPILMFTEMLKLSLGSLYLGGIVGVALVYLVLCFLASYGLSRGFSNQARGTIIFNSTFLNSMFLPFPLIYAFYGDLSVALLFSLPIIIVHNTIGIFLASYWGSGRVGKKTMLQTLTFPPLLAFFAGLLARPLLANFVFSTAFDALHTLGLLTVYLSLVLVGLSTPICRESLFVFRNRITGLITVNRMLISPLFALILIAVLNPTEIAKNTILIMSLMPPAITNLVIASKFGLDVRATSQSIFLPTLVSLGIIFALRFFALI